LYAAGFQNPTVLARSHNARTTSANMVAADMRVFKPSKQLSTLDRESAYIPFHTIAKAIPYTLQ